MHPAELVALNGRRALVAAEHDEERHPGNGEPAATARLSFVGRAGTAKYLGPGEHVMYATRRHLVVLNSAGAIWLTTLGLGLVAGLASRTYRGAYLIQAGTTVCLAGTMFLGSKAWQWWMASYVLTNDRVLLLEGVLSRRVHGVPLRSVLDTTYHRTLTGRLLGYGHLELNVSGQPGLRKLTSLPRPDHLYRLVLVLTSVRDVMEPSLLGSRSAIEKPSARDGGDEAGRPAMAIALSRAGSETASSEGGDRP